MLHFLVKVKKKAVSWLKSLQDDINRLKSNPNRTEAEDIFLFFLENELKLYEGTLIIVFCPPHMAAKQWYD